jgi:alpha-beta hydrolase superfamily lysophospholipase
MLGELTFVADPLVYGKRQSELIEEIRTELFKRSDIQKVSYPSRDGLMLSAYLVKRQNAQGNLILCHGYRGAKEFMYGYIDMFPQFNILFFDFRAHGQSEGTVISIGCHEYKDVLASTDFMKKHMKADNGGSLPLVLLGISMGGAASLKAAEIEKNACDALIVDSTFSNLAKILERGFTLKAGLPYYPFFYILKIMFQYFGACKILSMNTAEAVEKITLPVMFIHSCNDSFTKPSHSIRLYEHSASRYAKLWIGPKCRHGWLHSYYTDIYKKKVFKFLNKAGITITSAPTI